MCTIRDFNLTVQHNNIGGAEQWLYPHPSKEVVRYIILTAACRQGMHRPGDGSSIISIHMESLKKNTDFKKCYECGTSFVNRYLVLYMCGNGLGIDRVGITVSKKVGNSVVRHRTTRLIREAWRLHEGEFQTGDGGTDFVFVARVRAKGIPYRQMEYSLLQLMKKAGCIEMVRK